MNNSSSQWPNIKEAFMIRVFLVCDDPAFSEKLDNFFNLQHNFQVCGKAPRNLAAVQKAHSLFPDVAIIVGNGLHDLKVTDNFKKSIPQLPLFFMTITASVEMEKKAFLHGVDAVFSVDDELTSVALNAREVCPEKRVAAA
jgi:DNA-binding NarL/FixJ family response regulator